MSDEAQPSPEVHRRAVDYCRSSLEGFSRYLVTALLVSVSLWLLIATVAYPIERLKRDKEVLECGLRFQVNGRARYSYSQYAGELFLGDAMSVTKESPFIPYTSGAYTALDPNALLDVLPSAPKLADIDLCLKKVIEPVNSYIAAIKEESRLLSPAADIPISVSGDNTDIGALKALTEDKPKALLDKRQLDDAVIEALNLIIEGSQALDAQSGPVLPFDHDGANSSIAGAGSPPYAVNPAFQGSYSAKRLDSRPRVTLRFPLGPTFCKPEFKRIHTSKAEIHGGGKHAIEIRLRYSSSRCQISDGDAFEDRLAPDFTEDERWPAVSWADDQRVALRTNPYGDLYVLLRAPIMDKVLKAPLAWLAAQPKETDVPPDLMARAQDYLRELQLEPDPKMSLEGRDGVIERDIKRLRSDARAKVGGLDLPLDLALPAACAFLLIIESAMAYHIRRTRRLFDYSTVSATDLMFLAVPLLRRGPAARAMRAAFFFPSLALGAAALRLNALVDSGSALLVFSLGILVVGIVITIASLRLLYPLMSAVSEAENVYVLAG